MGEDSQRPRIPLEHGGVQVNFCKNPRCKNFGVPPSTERQPRGRGASKRPGRDAYGINSKNGRLIIECSLCKRSSVLKSNIAVSEELERMLGAVKPVVRPERCPTPDCPNKTSVYEEPRTAYHLHGSTPKGSVRFSCKKCGKTFSIPPAPKGVPHSRQKIHGFKNIDVFRQLVNNVVLNRICTMKKLKYKLLVDKMRFIHSQCQSFVAQRESELQYLSMDSLYLSTDRQIYNVNWSDRKDKRFTSLLAIGSAEKYSGYVFGMHLNFDASLNAAELNKEAAAINDNALPEAFRRFARLWLTPASEQGDDSLLDEAIDATIAESDALDAPSAERKLPDLGVQIHSAYTMYGHFHYLKHILPKTKRLVFYMDEESGIENALFSAFSQEVLTKQCEAFVVKISKEMNVNEKRRSKRAGDELLAEFIASDPGLKGLNINAVKQKFLERLIASLMDEDKILKQKEIAYPFPNMSEPEKRVRWVTDLEDKSPQPIADIAALYRRATLHPIDRFFMQIRSGVRALGRSMYTASNTGGTWSPNAPYNPERVVWLLEIYRTAYNYIFVGQDKKTPAMRLGLAKAPLDYKDIIYFRPKA